MSLYTRKRNGTTRYNDRKSKYIPNLTSGEIYERRMENKMSDMISNSNIFI